MRILSTFASLLSPFLDLLFSIICTCLYGRKRVSHIENATLRESACATARKLRRGELSSSAIVEACIARIREVDKVVHAVADEFFAEALHQAAQVDAELERLRKLEGTKGDAELDALFAAKPFYGVPTSIKSCFAVRGARWDVGLLSRLHVRAQYDASEVCRLRAAGFIVLCTSTVPEEVAWLETMSVIRPRTLNPYNSSRGAGGSSGGEAALIAAGGVPVGLGSDSGGSIRIPAAFCGIFGHKPTSDDSTHYGDDVQLGESKGKVHAGPGHYPPVFSRRQKRMLAFGPLCRHAEDLWPTLLASLCEEDRKRVTANGRSPATVNWSRTKFLLIPSLAGANGGPSGGDQFVNAPDRLVQEAIDRVVQFVKSELHADVEPLRFQSAEFESLQLVEMIDVFMEYSYLPDCVGVDEREPAAADWRTLDGRPWKSASMLEVHANYDEAHRVSPTRELLKKLLFFLPFKHRITMPILLSGLTESQVCERPHNSHVHSLRRGAEFERAFKHLFATYKQAGYENVVILCAAMPQVAPLHAKPVICSPFDAFYSGIFNVLGLPSSVAPILKDHARGTNLPAGVQIVSDKFDDVVCIAFANLLEQVFGGWREPSAD